MHSEPLSVQLRRLRRRRRVAREDAVRQLRRLFWDHDLRERDLDAHIDWVLERVLDYGSLEDVRLLTDLMGRDAFLKGVCRARFTFAKTESFWRQVLQREGLSCTRKRSPRTAWSF